MNINTLKLYLRSYLNPMRVTLDGNDNSVTINESLYMALSQCGVQQDNRILVFKIDTGTFAFCVCPEELKQEPTQFASLQVNSQYKTVGFESLTPSVNTMLYEWGEEPRTIARRVRVRYKRIKGLDCFVIGRPSKGKIEVIVDNPY